MKKIFVFLLMAIVVVSCSLLDRGFGYTDKQGNYVPIVPAYKLKDKPNNIIPNNLDTINIYRLFEIYEDGKKVYPIDKSHKLDYFTSYMQRNNCVVFMKFYPNGRCLSFSTPAKDQEGDPYELKEDDLNPSNNYYSKEYYYSNDGQRIQMEGFAYGDGIGWYVISNFFLSKTGDTLIQPEDIISYHYRKEVIPPDWKKYKVDW